MHVPCNSAVMRSAAPRRCVGHHRCGSLHCTQPLNHTKNCGPARASALDSVLAWRLLYLGHEQQLPACSPCRRHVSRMNTPDVPINA